MGKCAAAFRGSPFSISLADEGPQFVVGLIGELDLANCEDVRTMIPAGAPNDVVVDLARLTFVGCAGLGALIEARHRIVGAGGTFTARNPTTHIANLLILTGVDTVLAGAAPAVPQPQPAFSPRPSPAVSPAF